MPTFEITAPDGVKYHIEGPEGSTEDQALARLKAQLASEPKTAPDVTGEEPTPAERFVKGFAAPGVAIEQMISHAMPQPALPAGAFPGEVKKPVTVKRPEDAGFDPLEMAGTMMNPLPYAAPGLLGRAATLAPKIITPMVRSIAAGGVAGLLEPVSEEDEKTDFLMKKFHQVETGMALGYGFSIAGKGIGKGVEALGRYAARNHPDAVMDTAFQTVLRRIQQDVKGGGPTAQDAMDMINAAEASGKPLTLADVAGRNVRALAGNVTRQGGASRQIAESFLTKRDEAAALRLSQDIGRYITSGPTMFQATESLLKSRSVAARPLYEETDKLQRIWSPRLQEFLDNPDVAKGMARGYHIERLNSLAENRPFDPTMMGVDLDAQGNIKLLRTPSMRVLDMAKQGLDAMIADERDKVTGRLSSMGLALKKVKDAYLNELDKLDTSGVYRKARDSWSGPSGSLDAVRLGRAVFSSSPEENAADFAKLSKGDQEFYRIGVADMIRERLAKTGFSGDEAKQIIRNPWMRDQMRPAFRSQEDFDKFVEAVSTESKMYGTRQFVLGGSQTAERQAEDLHAMIEKGGTSGLYSAYHLSQGRILLAAANMWRLHRDLGIRPDPKLNEAIAKILFSSNSPESSLWTRLFSATRVPNRLAEPAARALDIAPYLAGGAAGPMVPTPTETEETTP